MRQQVLENIYRHIKSNAVDKKINPVKQNRHIRHSDGYIPGRSYLFDSIDAQGLVDKYHGTGIISITMAGSWKNNETVIADIDVGVNINPTTGEETTTNRFTIHYSKTGTHIVPAERRW